MAWIKDKHGIYKWEREFVGDPMFREKPIPREVVEDVIKCTDNNVQAAKFLGCQYSTWKKYSSRYINDEGQTLFQQHNQLKGRPRKTPIYFNPEDFDKLILKTEDIVEIEKGKVKVKDSVKKELIQSAIEAKYLKQECYNCGLKTQRIKDRKLPLLIVHRDGNNRNWNLDNLKLYCYNCYFYYVGDVINFGVAQHRYLKVTNEIRDQLGNEEGIQGIKEKQKKKISDKARSKRRYGKDPKKKERRDIIEHGTDKEYKEIIEETSLEQAYETAIESATNWKERKKERLKPIEQKQEDALLDNFDFIPEGIFKQKLILEKRQKEEKCKKR